MSTATAITAADPPVDPNGVEVEVKAGPYQVNKPGLAQAGALIQAGKVSAEPWSFDAADGNTLLGKDGDDWDTFGKFHLAVNPSAAEGTKDRYRYPFGKGGQVYRAALAAIRSRASQGGDTAVFEAAGSLMEKLKGDEGKGTTMSTTIEHKEFPFEVKAIDAEGPGHFEAEAAVFGNVDSGGDRILPGAFKNLDEFVRDGWLAVSHDWKRLGDATIDSAVQDGQFLRVRGTFHDIQQSQDVRKYMQQRKERGKTVPFSIGYEATDTGRSSIEGKSVRDIKALKLYEVSVVTKGMNARAGLVSVKGADAVVEHKGALLGDTRVLLANAAVEQMLQMLGWRLRQCLLPNGRAILGKCGYGMPMMPMILPGAPGEPEPFDPAAAVEEATEAIDEFRDELAAALTAIYRIPQTPADDEAAAGEPTSMNTSGFDQAPVEVKAAAARLADAFGWSPAVVVGEAPEGKAGTAPPFWDISTKLGTDAAEFVREARKRYEIRHVERKVGQELSAANRGKLKQLLDSLDAAAADIRDLLERTTPRPTSSDTDGSKSAPDAAADLMAGILRRKAAVRRALLGPGTH